MKFFLDENFPKAAVGMLEGMGHEVFDIRGTDREGSQDGEYERPDLESFVVIDSHTKTPAPS